MEIKTLIIVFILIGMIGLGTANIYFNQAFWRSEEIWLDEDNFDEDVGCWMKYANFAFKVCKWSFLIAGILVVVY